MKVYYHYYLDVIVLRNKFSSNKVLTEKIKFLWGKSTDIIKSAFYNLK